LSGAVFAASASCWSTSVGCECSERISNKLGVFGDFRVFGDSGTGIQLPPVRLAEVLPAQEDGHGRTLFRELELGHPQALARIGHGLLVDGANRGVIGEEVGEVGPAGAEIVGDLGRAVLYRAKLGHAISSGLVVDQRALAPAGRGGFCHDVFPVNGGPRPVLDRRYF